MENKVYKAQVAVIGSCGAMGSTTCSHLARRGVSVIGIDRFTRGHDKGSSTGYTRIFRTTVPQSPDYVPLAVEAGK